MSLCWLKDASSLSDGGSGLVSLPEGGTVTVSRNEASDPSRLPEPCAQFCEHGLRRTHAPSGHCDVVFEVDDQYLTRRLPYTNTHARSHTHSTLSHTHKPA